eukprot:Gregarina_sp_Poly_1__6911@NODE_374_length_9120_cov_202_678449_g308_i0_p1_GENE_NODE_374_length_9120_cov_202_678449_g308_i0NODE_374_length_9120_cov_202_678449_g308_i0_p1_ORF_typecomplete_len696_score113_27AMPbinding/PF00501_28/1_6e74AMPbinding_C/PF13193_6/3_7e03AMPbinding_C/PF13193_6/0_00047_NODE_374_length_9120_cov_202_678449_g308_i049247011
MGNSPSSEFIQYAVPTDDPPYPDATSVFRSAMHPASLVKDLPGVKWESPWDILQYRLHHEGFRDFPFLGSRLWNPEKQESETGTPGLLRWLTMGEVEELAIALARGLQNQKLVEPIKFPDEQYEAARLLRPLGVLSKNRPEWFILEQAASVSSVCLVPLYDSLGETAVLYILNETQMSCMAASLEAAAPLLKLLQRHKLGEVDTLGKDYKPNIHSLVLFDRPDADLTKLAQELNIKIAFWKDLVFDGRDLTRMKLQTQQYGDVGTLCYTSGTTGAPKGVIMTAGNFAATVAGHQRCIMAHPGFRTQHWDIHISYLPLAHVFERVICANVIALGVKIACYSGDTQKLLDDMKVIQPTIFLSVPRLFMRINDKAFTGIKDRSVVAQFLFNSAVTAKLKNLREKGVYTHPLWDNLVFNKTRKLMGGKVRFMLVGGAPIESIVQERMSVLFCCPLLHGYGMTEMGASFICNPGERVAGHIGGVQPFLEFCLRSIPEMGYLVQGEAPCGELLVRGPSVSPGYLMHPEATRDAFTPEGWLRSGDVAVLLQGNCIKIIDRKKNIFKLAQGEYVAPERVEGVYARASLVAQVFVYGESTKTALVAVVVPDEEMATKWTQLADRPFSSLHEVCVDEAFKDAMGKSLEEAAVEGGLKGFEKVKDFYITAEQFSVENNLLTPTLKLRRHECKKYFSAQISDMYSHL